jgi:hypothetical protein
MNLDAFLNDVQSNSNLPAGPSNLGAWITDSNLMGYLFGAAGIILLLMLIGAGYQLMTSRGDPKAVQMAQSKITTSLIGIIIIIFAYFITRLIMQFFGLDSIPGLF